MPAGPERGRLQAGEAVELPDGRTVRPDDVLGPERAGRKIVLTGDTAASQTVVEAARGAEVLVHEATFMDEERERAQETAHSTALEAAEIALEAGVGLLALTHLSNRYFGPEMAREARTIFPDTVVPKDFDVIDVPFAERGSPRLVKGGAAQRREAPEPATRARGRPVTGMVQVALAEDVTEAEEIQELLRAAGIESELETAVEHHPQRDRGRAAEGAGARVAARGRPARDRVADRPRRSHLRRLTFAEASLAMPTPGCAGSARASV